MHIVPQLLLKCYHIQIYTKCRSSIRFYQKTWWPYRNFGHCILIYNVFYLQCTDNKHKPPLLLSNDTFLCFTGQVSHIIDLVNTNTDTLVKVSFNYLKTEVFYEKMLFYNFQLSSSHTFTLFLVALRTDYKLRAVGAINACAVDETLWSISLKTELRIENCRSIFSIYFRARNRPIATCTTIFETSCIRQVLNGSLDCDIYGPVCGKELSNIDVSFKAKSRELKAAKG